MRVGELFLVPSSGAQFGDVVGHTSIQREDERKGKLRYGDGILAGAVGDVDATGGRAGNVDRVVAGASPDDERQLAGVEHLGGNLGAAHDQDVRAGRADRVGQGGLLEIRLIHDFATGVPKAIDAALFELVGDDNLHASTTFI